MSLIILKIVVNTTGFLISYISVDNGYYIPGILIGIGLLFASIIIPESYQNNTRKVEMIKYCKNV